MQKVEKCSNKSSNHYCRANNNLKVIRRRVVVEECYGIIENFGTAIIARSRSMDYYLEEQNKNIDTLVGLMDM